MLSCMGQANHALHMGPANIAPLLHCFLALFKASVAALFKASVAAMLKASVAAQRVRYTQFAAMD